MMTAAYFLNKKQLLSRETFFTKEEVIRLLEEFGVEVRVEQINLSPPSITHHMGKSWEEWKNTDHGKKCCEFKTLTAGEYLSNRLWRAFTDGYNVQLKK